MRSTFITSASNHTIAAASSGSQRARRGGRERQRAGQEVDAEVGPDARFGELLDLDVGLGPSEFGLEPRDHELGYEHPERSRELSGDHFGDERAGPLAGAAELHHVHPVVVCLDEPGQRAALAQGRHVASGGNTAQQVRRRGSPFAVVGHRAEAR